MSPTPIRIGIAVANLHDAGLRRRIADLLETQASDKIQNTTVPGQGTIQGAAFDYWGILSKLSDIAQVGNTLWNAYELFIAPKKGTHPNAGIYIVAPFPGQKAEFWLGKKQLSRAQFLREFEKSIAPLLKENVKKPRRKMKSGSQRKGKNK